MVATSKSTATSVAKPKLYTLGQAFGLEGPAAAQEIWGWEGQQNVPKVNPHYHFQPHILKLLTTWYTEGADADMRNPVLFGHYGTGKTEAILQFAARLGIPVFEDIGDESRVFQDFIGLFLPNENGVRFQPSMLIQSMQVDGAIYLMNEADKLSAKTWIELHNLLDTSTIRNPMNGDLYVAKPKWRNAYTMNTNGRGDHTGLYVGVRPLNSATISRFRFIPVNYMSFDAEVQLVMNVGIPEESIARTFVTYARKTRSMAINGQGIKAMMSTRQLVAWVRLCTSIGDSPSVGFTDGCLEIAYLASVYPQDREPLRQLYFDVFKQDFKSPMTLDASSI